MDLKTLKKQRHVTIEDFLRNYCQIENEYVISMLKDLSHHELKAVCQEVYKIPLSRISFDAVCQSDINSGNVLLVVDSSSNSAPYKNPQAQFQSIIDNPTPATGDFETEQYYEESVDLIEDNLTIEDVKIKSIGSFNIPKKKKGRFDD